MDHHAFVVLLSSFLCHSRPLFFRVCLPKWIATLPSTHPADAVCASFVLFLRFFFTLLQLFSLALRPGPPRFRRHADVVCVPISCSLVFLVCFLVAECCTFVAQLTSCACCSRTLSLNFVLLYLCFPSKWLRVSDSPSALSVAPRLYIFSLEFSRTPTFIFSAAPAAHGQLS